MITMYNPARVVERMTNCSVSGRAVYHQNDMAQRGFVLHYVIDNTQSEANLAELLAGVPLAFEAAGLLVTGPQLMAMELMERLG
jgi:hypothetical protein